MGPWSGVTANAARRSSECSRQRARRSRTLMRFQPPGEETIREMARLGLWPRASDFGRIRIVGVYEIPYFEDFTVVEVLENRPAWMISLENWWPYVPPGWD